MIFTFTNGQDPDFAALCVFLEDALEEAVGAVVDRAHYRPLNSLDNIHDAVIVYDGGAPVACGGFRQYGEGVAEIKRVFVKKEYRGRGISKRLMEMLESRASEQGYRTLILETNSLLVPALGLYQGLGYEVTDNYGPYAGDNDSLCMRKQLG